MYKFCTDFICLLMRWRFMMKGTWAIHAGKCLLCSSLCINNSSCVNVCVSIFGATFVAVHNLWLKSNFNDRGSFSTFERQPTFIRKLAKSSQVIMQWNKISLFISLTFGCQEKKKTFIICFWLLDKRYIRRQLGVYNKVLLLKFAGYDLIN